jgi:hypothetical protein
MQTEKAGDVRTPPASTTKKNSLLVLATFDGFFLCSFNFYSVASFHLVIFAGHGYFVAINSVNSTGRGFSKGKTRAQNESSYHNYSYHFFHDVLLVKGLENIFLN